MKPNFNRYLYIAFVLFGVYILAFKHELGNASIYFGIALAFDPFDTTQPWNKRPLWQRVVLILHLAIVFVLFGYEIGFNKK